MSIIFSCPSCAKTYSVPEQFAGRATRCQGCGAGLTVPQVALTAAPPAAVPVAAPPTPAWPQTADPLGRPDSGRQPWHASRMLVAGIAIAALLVVVAGGAAAFWLFGSSGAESMKFLPNNPNFVVSVKVDDLMASDSWKELEKTMPNFKKGTEDMEKETGLTPAAIAHVLMGGQGEGKEEPVVVVRTKKQVTASDLLAKIKNGKYTEVKVNKYAMQQGEQSSYSKIAPKAFCVVDAKLVVYGRADTLRAILERDKKPELSSGLQTALKETDLTKPIAFAVDFKDIMAKANRRPSKDPLSQGMGMVEALAGQATFNPDRITATALCKDAEAADNLRKLIEGGLVAAKMQPGLPKEFTSGLESVKVTSSGSKLTLTSDLKAATSSLIAITIMGQRATQTFDTVGKELKP